MWMDMNEKRWSQGEWNRVWRIMGWKEIKRALICSNQNMENDQITNGWNDKRHNNPESLGKGHPSLSRTKCTRQTPLGEGLESSHTNSHQ